MQIDVFIENLLFSLKGKRKENERNLTHMPVVTAWGWLSFFPNGSEHPACVYY